MGGCLKKLRGGEAEEAAKSNINSPQKDKRSKYEVKEGNKDYEPVANNTTKAEMTKPDEPQKKGVPLSGAPAKPQFSW